MMTPQVGSRFAQMKVLLVAGGFVDEIAGADGVFAAFRRGRPPSPPSA
jgi:hypothetical protein